MSESADASELLVGVAQFAPVAEKEENLRSIAALADRAVSRGARLVVFPEYSSYFSETMDAAFVAAAEPLHGPFTMALAVLAERFDVTIVAGMLETAAAADRVHNTVVAVRPGDGIVARYRKQHLYDAFRQRESDVVAPGALSAPELFDVDGIRIGMQTCFDLRFPEITRVIVDAGAQLVLVPAEWVRGPLKEQHWRTLVTARALENTVYVAAAGQTPPIGIGNSMIVDPMGVEIATVGEIQDVAVAHVSVERIRAVREVNPALSLRRYRVVAD